MSKYIPKTLDEIDQIRQSSRLVSQTLGVIKDLIRPGVSTLELDRVAEEFIRDNGGEPAFKNYQPSPSQSPFPFTLCVSVNEEVVHGFPGKDKVLKEGDIVSVDCGVKLNGFFGDSAYTFPVGEVEASVLKLLIATKASLYKGIEMVRSGNRLGDVSNAIQSYVEPLGYGIVREMVGHGLGRSLHEPPEVPNYGRRGYGMKLGEGLVIAIEPMINMGKPSIKLAKDGWTILASDHKPSAHFEHTVALVNGAPQILTTFEYIEN